MYSDHLPGPDGTHAVRTWTWVWHGLLGFLLLLASAAFIVFSWDALSNLFAEYQEGPSRTYVVIGALYLALALGTAAGGVALIRAALKRH